VSVKTSLFGGDVAAQEEAITAAIAANAAGIATTSPSPNTIPKLVKKARDAGIPVVTFNSDDTTADRIAYVGADLTTVGVQWAQYLVQNKLVKAGDTVFCPVEVAGASYQVLETTGINSIFAPLHIKADVFEAGSTPAPSTAAMESYLIAHPNVNAMICLGDQVATDVEGVFKALHWPPHKIPVVGWGDTSAIAHSVQAGYMDAAMFQYPDSQGYMPILLLKMVNDGLAAGYNISTSSLYDKTTVAGILKHM
jgi:simple sugar transport system substrate-binding protein